MMCTLCTSVDIILNSDILHSLIYSCTPNYYYALHCVISDYPHLFAFALGFIPQIIL